MNTVIKKNILKRVFCILLMLILSVQMFACSGTSDNTDELSDKEGGTEMQSTETQETDAPDTEEEKPDTTDDNYVSLDGKKIIFVGNSFIYYGQTVLVKSQSVLEQSPRNNDNGYFYQLCKSNGENVSVTNWTFGGHSFTDLFGGSCAADRGCDGVDHASYLTDRNYDYVVLSEGSGTKCNDPFMENMEDIMALFKAANPNVKFVYVCNVAPYGISSYPDKDYRQIDILNNLKVLAQQGVIIADWGKLVTDVINGDVTVPDAKQSYDQNSFIIRKSEADGYHPNLLTGYITTLMTYCAITGRQAVDQVYDFCPTTGTGFSSFKAKYYTYDNAETNFAEIFASKEDMHGLQVLVDEYLFEKPYLKYKYTQQDTSAPPSSSDGYLEDVGDGIKVSIKELFPES